MKKFYALLILLLTTCVWSVAQPGDPNGGNPPGTVPISGIEWLLISGGLLGVRKIFKQIKRS